MYEFLVAVGEWVIILLIVGIGWIVVYVLLYILNQLWHRFWRGKANALLSQYNPSDEMPPKSEIWRILAYYMISEYRFHKLLSAHKRAAELADQEDGEAHEIGSELLRYY